MFNFLKIQISAVNLPNSPEQRFSVLLFQFMYSRCRGFTIRKPHIHNVIQKLWFFPKVWWISADIVRGPVNGR